jgi:4-hydroxy-tetrahydrodipicolinate reductase
MENEMGIHAVRGGTIPGEHTVMFAGNDEIIEIKHMALSKKVFAEGAVRAAQYLANKEAGLYDMSMVISE